MRTRNQRKMKRMLIVGGGESMNGLASKLVAKVVRISAEKAAKSASLIGLYQPVVPEKLRQRKESK